MITVLRQRVAVAIDPLWGPMRSWIQSELLPRYQQLERREQLLLLVTAVLLPLMLLIFLVILPMQDRQTELRQSVAALKLQAVEAEQLAQRLLASGGGAKGVAPVNVLASVEQIARQNRVRRYMTRIRPQNSPGSKGQRLMIQLKNVPYQDLVRFVDALARAKLHINSMKVRRGASTGLTHVEAVISSS